MLNLNKKVCSHCKKAKEKKEFSARGARSSGKASWCKSCLNKWRKQDKAKNPNKYKQYEFARGLKRNYKMTVDQYNKMYVDQQGCCGCCGKHESEFKKKLHVDHNHTTGQVRGLLCTRCNPGIGYFEESIEKLEMAIKYLEKFKK